MKVLPACVLLDGLSFYRAFAISRCVSALTRILAFLALISLSSVPTGFMPDRSPDGSMALRICSGLKAPGQHSQIQPHHVGDTHGHHGSEDENEQKRCDFAIGCATDLAKPPFLQFSAIAPLASGPALHGLLTGISALGLPPSTGPPSDSSV